MKKRLAALLIAISATLCMFFALFACSGVEKPGYVLDETAWRAMCTLESRGDVKVVIDEAVPEKSRMEVLLMSGDVYATYYGYDEDKNEYAFGGRAYAILDKKGSWTLYTTEDDNKWFVMTTTLNTHEDVIKYIYPALGVFREIAGKFSELTVDAAAGTCKYSGVSAVTESDIELVCTVKDGKLASAHLTAAAKGQTVTCDFTLTYGGISRPARPNVETEEPGDEPVEPEQPDECEHDWSGWNTLNATQHYRECRKCHDKETGDHKWDDGEVVVEQGCLNDGQTDYVCTVCDGLKHETVPARGDHDWQVLRVESELSCETDGVTVYKCANCDETKTETEPCGGHDWGDYVKADNDVHTQTCANCGDTQPFDHSKTYISEDSVLPGCETEGEAHYHCDVCNGDIIEVIPELGHEWTDWRYKSDDNVNHYQTCERCHKYGESQAHNWVKAGESPADCINNGYISYRCDICDGTTGESTPPTGHKYADEWSYTFAEHWYAATCDHTELTDSRGEHDFSSGDSCAVCGMTPVSEGLIYADIGDAYAVTGIGTANAWDTVQFNGGIAIAPEYNGKPVTTIKSGAFADSYINKLYIPSTVTDIEPQAVPGNKVSEVVINPANAAFTLNSGCLINNKTKTVVTAFGNAVIPNDGSVEKIGSYAFYQKYGIESIVVPDSVTEIGEHAFSMMGNVETIELGAGLKSIGENAFLSTGYVRELVIPAGVESIGHNAFAGFMYLRKLTVDTGIADVWTAIGTLRDDLSLLEELVLGAGTETVTVDKLPKLKKLAYKGDVAGWCGITFTNGSLLKGVEEFYIDGELVSGKLVVPEPVTEIKTQAFYGCAGITSVEIADSVLAIGDLAFAYCTNLTDVVVGDGVTSMGEGIFYQSPKLVSLDVPFAGATGKATSTLGDYDINYIVRTATDYTYPVPVKSLSIRGGEAYYLSDGLTDIAVAFVSDEARFPGTLKTITVLDGCTELGTFQTIRGNVQLDIDELVIPASVTKLVGEIGIRSIGAVRYAGTLSGWCGIAGLGGMMKDDCSITELYFGNDRQEGDIIIPGTVEEIPDSAFYGREEITGVTISEGVTKIGSYAFGKCGMTEIEIPESVESIGGYAFDGSALTRAYIPASTTSVGGGIFHGCADLTELTVPCSALTGIGENTSSRFGHLFGYGLYSDYYGRLPGTLAKVTVLDDGTTVLPDHAFYGCNMLVSITVPDTLLEIGDYAFFNCTRLRSFVIPDSVTKVGKHVFDSCNGLINMTIGSSVTTFGSEYDAVCGNLIEVYNRSGLDATQIKYFSEAANFYTPSSGKSILSVRGDFVFATFADYRYLMGYIGAAVAELTLPASFDGNTYRLHRYAFAGDRVLEKVSTAGAKVTEVGDSAFSGCSRLRELDLSGSIVTIEDNAFSWCDLLTTVTFGAELTTIGDEIFGYCFRLVNISVVGEDANFAGVDGCLIEKATGTLVYGTAEAVIPDDGSVLVIGEKAFWSRRIKNVVIPANVRTIAKWAFKDSYLESVTFAEGSQLTEIQDYAFSASQIKSIVLPASLKTIGVKAFYICSLLTSVVCEEGSSLESVGEDAFAGCGSLTELVLPGGVYTA